MHSILAVDDSASMRQMVTFTLKSAGYNVVEAVDGQDAWEKAGSRDFDLVLTDQNMPRMDGIELVGLIRKDANLKSLPAMIVSYKDREEDRQRGLEAGADYYLSKGSFHDDQLVEAVVDLIGEATV